MKILIASSKSWFEESEKSLEFKRLNTIWVTNPKDLTLKNLQELAPDYVFFPHWNWRVEPGIYESFNCVLFHTAPLPFGRGGSPIQNLILSGFSHAPVNALAMGPELDAGDILLSKEVSLEGDLSEIFRRISSIIQELIVEIVEGRYTRIPQKGDATIFKRRTGIDNALPTSEGTLNHIYNHIRMLDAPDYPKAYLEIDNFRLEFNAGVLKQDSVEANVVIYRRD